jgi:hypothetical protein
LTEVLSDKTIIDALDLIEIAIELLNAATCIERAANFMVLAVLVKNRYCAVV